MIKTTKKTKLGASRGDKPKVESSRTDPAISAPVSPGAPKTNRVSLHLVRPDAKQVYVAGSFNGWKPETTPLWHAGDGRWVGDLTVRPGRHEYMFVVDGQWLPDPNARETVENPYGGRNSVLIVSE